MRCHHLQKSEMSLITDFCSLRTERLYTCVWVCFEKPLGQTACMKAIMSLWVSCWKDLKKALHKRQPRLFFSGSLRLWKDLNLGGKKTSVCCWKQPNSCCLTMTAAGVLAVMRVNLSVDYSELSTVDWSAVCYRTDLGVGAVLQTIIWIINHFIYTPGILVFVHLWYDYYDYSASLSLFFSSPCSLAVFLPTHSWNICNNVLTHTKQWALKIHESSWKEKGCECV